MIRKRIVTVIPCLLLILFDLNAQNLDERIRQRVEFARFQETNIWGDPLVCTQALYNFYENRMFQPVWSKDKDVDELIEIIRMADFHGLQKEDYHYIKIKNIWEKHKDKFIGMQVVADFDVLLTDAYLLLAGHLLSGKVDPKEFDPNWFAVKNEGKPGELLEIALKNGIKNSFNLLIPKEPAYLRMVEYLKKFNETNQHGGWDIIATDQKKIEKGYTGPEMTKIKKRLAYVGDYTEPETSEVYNEELEPAVIRFQKRHGLLADGVIGAQTIDAMNIPTHRRMDQIKINMERYRWLNRDLGDYYVLVNIANYELGVFDHDEKVMQKRVVVGKAYRMTPVFSSTMEYIVLNPDWTVPPTILKNDILSVAVKDPSVIQKKKLKVVGYDGKAIDPFSIDWSVYSTKSFPYQLKQDPGPDNALGVVKFIFPNSFNVYLHDTPQKDLFNKPERALSSGCIRVEKPLELAGLLLKDRPEWNVDKINSVVASKKTTTIFLDKEVNVHLQYFTSWVDENGILQFRKDIYDRDSLVFKALSQHMDTISLPELNR